MTLRSQSIHPAGTWNQAQATDEVLIDDDRRHRRRILLKTESGAEILLDLPQAARLRDGDGLALDTGAIIRVRARPEPLAEIHAHSDAELVRIAWHLGNRHLPVQLIRDKIRIRRDHVIEEMVEHLGGHIDLIDAPFDPEAGAYAAQGSQHHQHSHDNDEDTSTATPMSETLRLRTWHGPLRIGTGKTALMDALCKRFAAHYDIAARTPPFVKTPASTSPASPRCAAASPTST